MYEFLCVMCTLSTVFYVHIDVAFHHYSGHCAPVYSTQGAAGKLLKKKKAGRVEFEEKGLMETGNPRILTLLRLTLHVCVLLRLMNNSVGSTLQ